MTPLSEAKSLSASNQESGWAGPLQGLRVVDLTRVLAGPFCTQSLGDLGAEVLKVEPPDRGDETRHFPPFIGGESHYFLGINRNKKSLVIDLQKPAGAEILRRLVAKADILVENYRPGVMDRLGLGYDKLSAINPRLIYCAISGFGLSGPLRDKPSFDIVTQALTGALSINGERGHMPVKLGIPLGDMVGGVFGPIAILAALHERSLTGRGRLIDISLYDGLIGMLGYFAQLAFITGEDPPPNRRRMAGAAHGLRRSPRAGARRQRRSGSPARARARDGDRGGPSDGRLGAPRRTSDQVSRGEAASIDRAADPGSTYRASLA